MAFFRLTNLRLGKCAAGHVISHFLFRKSCVMELLLLRCDDVDLLLCSHCAHLACLEACMNGRVKKLLLGPVLFPLSSFSLSSLEITHSFAAIRGAKNGSAASLSVFSCCAATRGFSTAAASATVAAIETDSRRSTLCGCRLPLL